VCCSSFIMWPYWCWCATIYLIGNLQLNCRELCIMFTLIKDWRFITYHVNLQVSFRWCCRMTHPGNSTCPWTSLQCSSMPCGLGIGCCGVSELGRNHWTTHRLRGARLETFCGDKTWEQRTRCIWNWTMSLAYETEPVWKVHVWSETDHNQFYTGFFI
jgi:hypothetical protein